MDELITILTSQLPGAFAVARTYLQDNGVDTFIKDELMNQSYLMATSAELQVRNDQVEDAIRLLIEGGFAKIDDFQADEMLVEVSEALKKLSLI